MSNEKTMDEIAEESIRKTIKEKGEQITLPEFKEEKKKYVIDYIKFIDFMKIHNFRNSHKSLENDDLDNDTKIIRIMYGETIDNNPFRDKDTWFEFGIYNFGSTRKFVESLNTIFSENILNSYVCSFCVDEDTGILNVWLTKEQGDEWDD